MTISERIFSRLSEIDMSQKEFSEKTDIKQSTISEWKKKKTNPSSDKIMIICKVLDVSPEWLLSGIGSSRKKQDDSNLFVVHSDTEAGLLFERFINLPESTRQRILGYVEGLSMLREMNKKKK